jgi:hypothetical protein
MSKILSLSQLRTLYKKPSVGLVGKSAFIKNLEDGDYKFIKKDVDVLFESEASITLNKPVVKNFERRPIIVDHTDQTWGADLAFLPQFKEENDGYTTMLFVIDFFSKYIWVTPVKDKKSVTITEAFKKILKDRKPENLNVDGGGEFKGDTLKYLEGQGVNVYQSYNETKVPIVERVQRTIKKRIGRLLDNSGEYRYIGVLPEIVKSYNNTVHSTIKMTPKEASKKESEAKVRANIQKFIDRSHKIKKCAPKFAVGDYVRISIKKGLFEKEITWNWSKEIFKIKEVLSTVPCTYAVEDLKGEELKGSFYEAELQKVVVDDDVEEIEILKRRVVKGQKQAQVKYSSGKIAWILEDDLTTL